MKAAWDGLMALLDQVPVVWYGVALAALYAALTTAGRRVR